MLLAPSVSTLSFSRSPINGPVPGSQCTSPLQVLPWGQEKEIFMWAQFLECCVSSDSLYPSVLAIKLCTLHYLEILDLSSSFLTMTFYVSQRFLLNLPFLEFSTLLSSHQSPPILTSISNQFWFHNPPVKVFCCWFSEFLWKLIFGLLSLPFPLPKRLLTLLLFLWHILSLENVCFTFNLCLRCGFFGEAVSWAVRAC